MTTPSVTEMLLTGRRGRFEKAAQVAATIVFLATLVVVGTSLVVWGGLGFPKFPMSFVRGPLGVIEIATIALVYTGVGAFLVGRIPGVIVGWSLIVLGVGVALHLPDSLLVSQAIRTFHPIPEGLLVFTWALTSSLVPLAAATITVLIMVLPDGRLPSRRWRMVTAATISGFLLLTLGSALAPSGLIWFPTLPNPLAMPITAAPLAASLRVAGVGMLAVGLGLAMTCLVRRYRSGDAELRRLLRWILVGCALWAVSLAGMLFSRYLVGVSDEQGTVFVHIAAIGTLAVPITILIATVRYHMFGAQVILSRTLVYIPLLAICSGIYSAGVALSQRLFVALTGNSSDLAIIFATLLAAGAIMPLRRWLETIVDRIMAPASPQPALDIETEHRGLTEQAMVLSSRLAEVETRLAKLDATAQRDVSLEAGEPGVGRPGWAGDPDVVGRGARRQPL